MSSDACSNDRISGVGIKFSFSRNVWMSHVFIRRMNVLSALDDIDLGFKLT